MPDNSFINLQVTWIYTSFCNHHSEDGHHMTKGIYITFFARCMYMQEHYRGYGWQHQFPVSSLQLWYGLSKILETRKIGRTFTHHELGIKNDNNAIWAKKFTNGNVKLVVLAYWSLDEFKIFGRKKSSLCRSWYSPKRNSGWNLPSLAAVPKYILIFFLKATNRIEHFATDILFHFFFFFVRLPIFYFKRLIFLDVSTMVCLIFGCLQSNNFWSWSAASVNWFSVIPLSVFRAKRISLTSSSSWRE